MNLSSPGNGHEDRPAGVASSMSAPVYDALSALMKRLFESNREPSLRSILLTSANPTSGVSYLASCMSTLLAEKFGATVIVDAEVLTHLARFGILPNRTDCTQVNNSQLWVLGHAEIAKLDATLSPSPVGLGTIINMLTQSFTFVIVDAPALAISDTAALLSAYVDGTVLVVVPGTTELRDLASARITLTSRGGHVLGSIYNSRFSKKGE